MIRILLLLPALLATSGWARRYADVVAGADLRLGMQCLLLPLLATSTPRERPCSGVVSANAITTTVRALANQARRLFTITGSMLLPLCWRVITSQVTPEPEAFSVNEKQEPLPAGRGKSKVY
ncbi:hypothetical protein GN264_17360 [Escherichia coli]|nr:hypothetical protein [Escherichia coli]